MTSSIHHKILVVLLAVFSLSLALSKSAVNVVMTLTYATALMLIVLYRDDRRSLFSNSSQPLILPLLAYLAVSVIGISYTENVADGFGIANKVAGIFLAYFMTSVVIDAVKDTDERAKLTDDLVLIFIAGVLLLDMIGLLTYLGIIADRKFSLPVYPLHVHHIWFANVNAVGIYAALSFLLFGRKTLAVKRKALLAVFMPIAFFSVLFSTSRTAWFGLILTGIALAILYVEKKRRLYPLLVAVVIVGVLSYLFIPIVHDRVHSGFADLVQYRGGNKETSMGWRFLMWKASVSMFLSNPLFGIGTGDYVVTMQRYIASGAYPASLLQYNQPHNMYLFALATNGLLGLTALLYLFFRILSASWQDAGPSLAHKRLAFLATAVAIHYLVAGMTDSLFNIFILRFTFAFIMGVCIRAAVFDRAAGNNT